MIRRRFLVWTTALVAMVATAAAFALPADTARDEGTRLEADLSERTLTVYVDGEVMNTFPIAVGEDGHETPTGDFTISRVIWNPDWVPPNAEWAEDATRKEAGDPENPMRGAKLFFEYPDYYIHGTDEPESIGEAASKGCLRMTEVDVENLAQFVQKVGGEDRGEDWFQHVRNSESDTREVELSDPVPISIHW